MDTGDPGLIPGLRISPGEREWPPAPVFLPGESYGQRSLAVYSSWGRKESDMTERHTHSRGGLGHSGSKTFSCPFLITRAPWGGAAISRVTDLAARLWAPRASVGRSKSAHCHSGKSVPGQMLSHATSSRGPRCCQLPGLILYCGLHRRRGGSPIFTSLEFSLTVFL